MSYPIPPGEMTPSCRLKAATPPMGKPYPSCTSDITALLVDFLGELVRLASTYKEAYSRIIFDELSSSSLRATLVGEKISEFGDDIKAVTYHEANIVKNAQGRWETDIVFDI